MSLLFFDTLKEIVLYQGFFFFYGLAMNLTAWHSRWETNIEQTKK